MAPAALYYMWFLFGIFGGYDNRNCNFVEKYPGAIVDGEPAFVECWGPPLPPFDPYAVVGVSPESDDTKPSTNITGIRPSRERVRR